MPENGVGAFILDGKPLPRDVSQDIPGFLKQLGDLAGHARLLGIGLRFDVYGVSQGGDFQLGSYISSPLPPPRTASPEAPQ